MRHTISPPSPAFWTWERIFAVTAFAGFFAAYLFLR